MTNISVNDEDEPRLHRNNEKWQITRATGPIEGCLKAFEDKIIQERRKRKNLKG